MNKLGRVSQLVPLRVRLNGETQDAPASPLSDFAGSSTATEVLVQTVEGRRFATRVLL